MPSLGEDCCEAVRQYLTQNNMKSLGQISAKILCEIIDRVQEHREAVERKRRKDSRKARENGFHKPTAEEVTAFGLSIGFPIDGEEFCAHYESNGWLVGKTRMISWHAAVQTWKKHEPMYRRANGAGSTVRPNASLGALQMQVRAIENDLESILFPGGSATKQIPAAGTPLRLKAEDLERQRFALKAKIRELSLAETVSA